MSTECIPNFIGSKPGLETQDNISTSFPSTVEALAIATTGDIDVIEKMTLPFPKVNPGDLVVKVSSCAFVYVDDLTM